MEQRLFLLVLSLLAASCIDPVHDDAVAALGPEANGERPGPRHRPDQPCFTCHGGNGPAPDFAVAGTVYAARDGVAPIAGVVVDITDANGATRQLQSNEVGNFYLPSTQWVPAFPLHVRLEYGGATKDMDSRIGRNGGCATCHVGSGDPTRMPHVYMSEK